ncbi:MAG: Rrf2 family transcriptional regulator [Erysipelotrichales bacterium]
MKLTKALDQGICIITMLSRQVDNLPVSTNVINQRLNGSPSYLQKITRKLVVAGLVNSVSGNNGGFVLARKPEDINLLEIVEAIEGKIDTYPKSGLFRRFFADMPFVDKGERVIHNTLLEADAAWSRSLENKSVQDIIDVTFGSNEAVLIDWNKVSEL